jgi:predicted metal-dependent phosphotriesterase family hydrolase
MGGWGYAHILRTMRQVMTDSGISANAIEQLLVHNPSRMLSANFR